MRPKIRNIVEVGWLLSLGPVERREVFEAPLAAVCDVVVGVHVKPTADGGDVWEGVLDGCELGVDHVHVAKDGVEAAEQTRHG